MVGEGATVALGTGVGVSVNEVGAGVLVTDGDKSKVSKLMERPWIGAALLGCGVAPGELLVQAVKIKIKLKIWIYGNFRIILTFTVPYK